MSQKLLGTLVAVFFVIWLGSANAEPVKASELSISLMTYSVGDPEPNPMFYFGQSSQGAEGRVYPYPLYDRLTNTKSNRNYRIIYLENEYVRIGVLPEIGGRLFEAVDKSNGYNFIYRQHVIKPALIGLLGAWISGGIEWNIPHHHRATTFLPVQYRLTADPDGSKTVWVGELELRDRMRWAVGYTLHPGKSYLECDVRIINRTPMANSMLCFANVAVHVNKNYQVIYPPDTRFVTFHSKRDFTTWPVATTRYAGTDFTRGVDVSWYSNHFAATSMFAWNYDADFFAGYDHGRQAGIMSIADHHVVPGKKFWTWGNGPRGRMWDKILTDNDGPYIELMVGAYSDNQPDYSWLEPYETRSFKMFWYPFQAIGGVKQATLEAAVNLEVTTNGIASLGFCTTARHKQARITLKAGEKVLLDEQVAISPAMPCLRQVRLTAVDPHLLRAGITVGDKELVGYRIPSPVAERAPAPVTGPEGASEIMTVEQLYLAGLRVEQFHDPRQKPEKFWEEALRRDPGDARVNTALGARLLKQARFSEAEPHFRRAIDRMSFNYTAPKDGEAFYYLGLSLLGRARDVAGSETKRPEEPTSPEGSRAAAPTLTHLLDRGPLLAQACEAFYRAVWSEAWRSPAYFSLAEMKAAQGDFASALPLVQRSLEANALNLRALTLKAALLRHLGSNKEAWSVLDFAGRQVDPLDVRLLTERWLAGEQKAGRALQATLSAHPATGLETATEYSDAGLWRDGIAILTLLVKAQPNSSTPLAYYYLSQFAARIGDDAGAARFRLQAKRASPDYAFPFQVELIPILRHAMAADPTDALAPYYLGNLLFDWQPEVARQLWERSASLDPSFPIVHRNLAIAYQHQDSSNNLARAIAQLELAVAAPNPYARHFAELDEMYSKMGVAPEKRLALLEKNDPIILQCDDALSRAIGLKIFAGKYDEAIRLMTGRKFSVWEGGSLEVVDHWVNAHLLRGRQELARGNHEAAAADFQAAGSLPENLPSEHEIGRSAELAYWSGEAYAAMDDQTRAKRFWDEAVDSIPAADQHASSDISAGQVQAYFNALAQQKLGQSSHAEQTFRRLADSASEARKNSGLGSTRTPGRDGQTALAHYLAGLGHLGLAEHQQARSEFELALKSAPDMLGPKAELANLR